MKISKIIVSFYIKTRQILKKLLFYIFSENSKIINLFVNLDVFLRKLVLLNNSLRGEFEYDGLIFQHDESDTSVSSSLLFNGTYEPELLKEIKTSLNIGSNFIDGGANIGFFSLVASKIVGPSGVIISFEPTPLTSSFLKKNIKINNVNNIIVSEYGLSSSKKQLPFLLSNNPEGNAIISDKIVNSSDASQVIKISTISIDEFCVEKNILKVDLIKLDIEGQELEAIKGAKKTLLANQNIKIIFELNIAHSKDGIEYAKEIYNELKKLHFLNFYTLLNPRIAINNLDNDDNIKLLKKITDRHNVNILATR
jgi:FkbM family methyltransferase